MLKLRMSGCPLQMEWWNHFQYKLYHVVSPFWIIVKLAAAVVEGDGATILQLNIKGLTNAKRTIRGVSRRSYTRGAKWVLILAPWSKDEECCPQPPSIKYDTFVKHVI